MEINQTALDLFLDSTPQNKIASEPTKIVENDGLIERSTLIERKLIIEDGRELLREERPITHSER